MLCPGRAHSVLKWPLGDFDGGEFAFGAVFSGAVFLAASEGDEFELAAAGFALFLHHVIGAIARKRAGAGVVRERGAQDFVDDAFPQDAVFDREHDFDAAE